jgi:hypothetical protein
MKDAKYFLVVRFSVEPQAEAQVLGWLDGGHMKEVASQRGFRERAPFEKHMRIERFHGEVEAAYAA